VSCRDKQAVAEINTVARPPKLHGSLMNVHGIHQQGVVRALSKRRRVEGGNESNGRQTEVIELQSTVKSR
jgi:hypothetical protein